MLDVCLHLGYGGVGDVDGEWVGAWNRVRWCYVCVSCESGFSV